MLRRQLPAWSPVNLAALGAGLRAVVTGASGHQALEERIRDEYGCPEVVLTDSGTNALALGIRALAGSAKPKVALPAYGCFDLMTAADAVQAEVVLYDLDPRTLGPDLESLRAALRQGPQSVVIAHWYGLVADAEKLLPDIRDAGAVLIEDAAQGVGARLRGYPVGSFGDLAVLSFGRGKGRTGGQGGALIVKDAGLFPTLRQEVERSGKPSRGGKELFALGALWALGRPGLFWLPAMIPGLRLGETIYRRPGKLSALPVSAAAVLNSIWEAAEREAEVRREHARRWLGGIEEGSEVTGFAVVGMSEPGWLRFPLRARGTRRELLAGVEARRRGVMPGYPNSLAALGRPVVNFQASFPGAQALVDECFTLPTHRMVSGVDFEAVRALLRSGA